MAVPVAAVGLVACGGSGGSGSGGSSADEKQITDAIVNSGTTDSPANCTELETQRFVEQNELESGTAAVDACKADTNHADSIEVTNIKIDGDKATAESAVTGSALDGQTLQIGLIKHGGAWKLVHLDKFTDFNRDTFAAATEKTISQSASPPTAAQIKCITDTLGKQSDEQLQTLVLSGDQKQAAALITPCFTG